MRRKFMNHITHHDFGLFETELLCVDFISFNIKRITSEQISRLASYFQNLGFNCYQKQLDYNQSRQDINDKNSLYNQFEVYFIMKIPYQKEIIQLQFPGVSGKQFYKLIKQRAIQWEKLPNPVFSRLDLVYQRISKSNDPFSTMDFINSCYIQFQELHSSKNLLSERNQKGLILKIGNRRSSKHYRIYTNKNNNLLRFEAEMKGDLIKDFQDLLVTSSFEEQKFESKIAYQFFKYSFEIFNSLNQPSHIDWLATRIRPYQNRNSFSLESAIHSDYLRQMDFKLMKEKQHLIMLLRLLAYLNINKVKYKTKSLTSKFRQYKFPLSDFIDYNNSNHNYYQVKKFKTFFDLLKKNFIIESFSNKDYRMLVTIPEVCVYKSKQNILMIEIWIAENLFDYLHPFLFSDMFKKNLNKQQFQVLFEIIKTYSSTDIRKEFNISKFLENYPSILSNQHKRQIKEYFIQYLEILYQEGKLQDKFIDLSSNKILDITELNSSYLQIAVFESFNVKFL
nr:hypothetical protein [Cylindrotheca closterium]